MPGLPLPTRENTSSARRGSSVHLSAEDAIAAEESLSQYCKPVELYNVLQRRSLWKPLILQRCLQYKIEARRQRRIQMNISLSETLNTGEQVQDILPLYVLLAKPNPYNATGGHSAVYIIKQARVLTASREFKSRGQHLVNFILPEINELLAEANSNKLTILLLSRAERKNSLCEKNVINDHIDTSYPSNFGGYCLWGEMPILSLDWSPVNSVNLSSVHGAEMLSTVAMQSCFLEQCSLKMGSDISFKIPDNHVTMQVQVSICVQELRAKESFAYNLYTHENIPTPELSYIMRLRYGNVLFNYKYYNNTLQKTEATEDFSCPFCLVQCASFKGLRLHLRAFHDLFCYEFWVTEDYQIVNVYLKSDTFKFETADGVDPKLEQFYFCAKPRKRRRSRSLSGNAKNVYTNVVRSETPEMAGEGFLEDLHGKEDGASSIPMPKTYTLDAGPSNKNTLQKYDNGSHHSKEMDKALKSLRANDLQENSNVERNCTVHPSLTEGLERVASSPNVNDTCTAMAQSGVGLECFQQESGGNAMLQFAKTRKLSIERSDPRNRILLQKRQFFHSHRAQPMAVEQVLSDRDSEDEVDDDIADFEDRRMLDDFVDVTKDEKRIMHLWNSFVRKQRVLADGHIPWACEAFSRLHADDFSHSLALMWCWRLLMIKLWNHSLLDANTMDKCNKILQKI